jgi:hypothetical protein
MHITEEFWGNSPNLALLNGHPVECEKPSAMPSAAFPGTVSCSLPATRLGFAIPSLVLAERAKVEGNGLKVFAKDQGEPTAQSYLTAATTVQPLVQQWLGTKPKEPLNIIQLPEKDDTSAELGASMLTGMQPVQAEQLAASVSHGFAHAYFHSQRIWLNEGVANFLGTLWIEQSGSRVAALERLEAARGALTFAEPGREAEKTSSTLRMRSIIGKRPRMFYGCCEIS